MRRIFKSKNISIVGLTLGISAFLVAFILGQVLPPEVAFVFVGQDNFAGMSSFMARHSIQLFSLLVLIPFWLIAFKRLTILRPGLSAAASLVLVDIFHNLIFFGILPVLATPYLGWWVSLLTYALMGLLLTPVAVKLFARIKNDSYAIYIAFVVFAVLPFAFNALSLYLRHNV